MTENGANGYGSTKTNMNDSLHNQTVITDHQQERTSNLPQSSRSPESPLQPDMFFNPGNAFTVTCERFDVILPPIPGEENTSVQVTCPKPVQLKYLLSQLQTNGNIPKSKCKIEYHDGGSGECIKIVTQKKLEVYMKLDKRPQLSLSDIKSKTF